VVNRGTGIVSILFWLALLAGVIAGAYGLSAVAYLTSLPWTAGGCIRFGVTLAVLVILVPAVARVFRLGVVAATVTVSAGILVALGALLSLLIVGLLGLASIVVGSRLRRLWLDDARAPDDSLIDMLVGLGAYGTLISVLAHVPIAHPATYALLIGLPIALDRHAVVHRLRLYRSAFLSEPRQPLVAWVAGVMAVIYAITALMPEIGFDSLAMHLFIPTHLAINRGWSFDPARYSWALFPTLVDFLYGIVYVLDGERAARLLNAAFVSVLAALVYRIASLAGATRAWAWFGAALTLATPIVFMIGSSLFIDTIWSAFTVGSVLLLLRPAVAGQPPRAWITAAALAGFAAASKAVTLPLLPVLAALVALQYRSLQPKGSMRVLGLAAAAFAVFGLKPYLTAWLVSGNPVYPFFMQVFGGEPPFPFWATGPHHFSEPLTWTTIYDATFVSTRFVEGRAGSPGFQWILLLPAAVVALVATRHRRGLLVAVAGLLMIALVFHFMAYLRYVIPAFCLLIAAIAVAGTAMQQRSRLAGFGYAAAGAVAIGANLVFLNAAGFYASYPVESVLTANRRRAFLEAERPVLAAIDVARRLPSAGERLAIFGQPAFAAAPGRELVHPSWYTPLFLRDVDDLRTPTQLADRLADWNVRYVVVEEGLANARLPLLAERATKPVAVFRGVSVREVPRESRFRKELLQDAAFEGTRGWTLVDGARHDASQRLLAVTVHAPAYQVVPVKPGRVYFNAVRARCPDAAGQARVQVNWLDAQQRFIRSDLKVFDCTAQWTEREQEVAAPPRAGFAVVYASSANASPVQIGAVSMRGVD
jgi:4-amino-4-deoxy-L-arabinose transferase-like glycosyltransferase